MFNKLIRQIIPEYTDEQKSNSSFKFSIKTIYSLFWLFCCTYLVYYLQIEKNKGFDKVAVIMAMALLPYVFIPIKYKKLYLVGLTLLVECYLIGIKLAFGVFLFILFFVAFTYINNKKLRLFVVSVTTILCILIFSKIIIVPFVRHIIMFGSMFVMLRYIYFLYELNYFKQAPVFIDRVCYLFLLPNVCFPLFPALDPNDYRNSFYSVPSEVSFKQALVWMTRGIWHLLIYRFIYMFFSPSPYEVEGFATWLWFIISAYSFIFRLSGLFYLAFGFLQIFGFKFPPVFDHFYLASSFTDLWRKVNLYWRTFMMRVFYYPLVFKFKKHNPKTVLFVSTLIMFVFTWFLHSWQWYWIKGSFYLYATDMFFWGILGIVISIHAVVSYNEINRKASKEIGIANNFVEAGKVVFMFFCMCFLWSLWTASSVYEFYYMVGFALTGSRSQYLVLIFSVLATVGIAGVIRYLHVNKGWFNFVFTDFSYFRGIGFCFLIFGSLQVFNFSNFSEEVNGFISMNLNKKDKSMIERGYYEQLLNNDDKSIEMVNIGSKLKKWDLDNKAYVRTNNELIKEFIPSFTTTFKGDTLSTNSFGIRDKEYKIKKESNVVRLAFIGGSYVMGSGVSNEENFAALIENRFSEEATNKKIEILNFGEGGYHLIQCVYVTENKLAKYNSDYLFYFIHSSDRMRCLDNLANLVQKEVPLSFSYLKDIVRKAGIRKKMSRLEIYNRLKPFVDDLFYWGFKTIYDKCNAEKIQPIAVYLPTNANLRKDTDKYFCINLAKKTGFYVIDLDNVYDGYNAIEIQLSSWDTHPNEKGHRLISDKLYEEMKKDTHFFNFIR